MMKKLLMLLALIFATLIANAQIKRNFDGLILGKSTKSEVKSYLSKKGFYFEELSSGTLINSPNEVSSGGVIWTYVHYRFFNNILYMINFTKIGKPYTHYSMYKELRGNLYKKYVKKTPKDDSSKYPPKTTIVDKSSTIYLFIIQNGNTDELKLTYVDKELHNKQKKQNIDDL